MNKIKDILAYTILGLPVALIISLLIVYYQIVIVMVIVATLSIIFFVIPIYLMGVAILWALEHLDEKE